MDNNIFRKKNIERLNSPEDLNDHLHVTSPAIWVVLTTLILLIAALFAWSAFTAYESTASGTGTVEKGMMLIAFDDEEISENVEVGMKVSAGDVTGVINYVGRDTDGMTIASADMKMPDGVYDIKVQYKQTQIISLLFN